MDATNYYGSEQMTAHIAARAETRRDRLKFCLGETLTGLRILDLGCGPGVQISYLTKANFVVGGDAGLGLLRIARGNGYKTCQCDLDKPFLPFQDSSFDVVVCTDVLEHLFSPENLLLEIHRVLKPDGRAILEIPNHFDLTGRLRVLFGGNLIPVWHRHDFHAWDYFHIRFWTLTDVHRFLEKGGFHSEEDYHQYQPSHVLYMVSLLLDPNYVATWHQRHRRELVRRVCVSCASLFLRFTLLPKIAVAKLPKQFPSLFSAGFIVKAGKRG